MTKGDEVAQFLIQERGHLIVGFITGAPRVGDCIEEFARMPLSQPIVLMERASWEEWLVQGALVRAKLIADPTIPRIAWAEALTQESGIYFRAMTD